MADPRGFLTTQRETPARRPVDVRIGDWREVYTEFGAAALERQAGRCMDCGIPFCHSGCPLGNLIPEWNDLVWRQDWRKAAERLHATNNFPEFTGRLCPAPCESACVLGINADPVAIKQVEVEIVDRAWAEGWAAPRPPGPAALTGKKVAVIGSGPAGLAAAQQLTRAGHAITVYERADAPGGLLRYGIPEFKMEKRHLDRRLAQMRAEGTEFVCGVNAGVDVPAAALRAGHDAIVLAGGATVPRGLPVPGAGLDGIHQAMDYLPFANRAATSSILNGGAGDRAEAARAPGGEDPPAGPGGPASGEAASSGPASGEPAISARGRHVVIIGGGDTGADCLGTAHRQGAASVTQLEIMQRPPAGRPEHQPWPTHPMVFRVSSAHEEGGERVYAVSTREFLGDAAGRVRALRLTGVEFSGGRFNPVPGTERELPCDLVLLAMGFTGAERTGLIGDLGVEVDARGNVARDVGYATSVPGVFVAGDMGRGQSLIVWAIAEGRSAAAAVDAYLMGETALPSAIPPTARPLT
ncbi:MAG: glutamate synthase subunit beta [Streptosporangiales bacterium]